MERATHEVELGQDALVAHRLGRLVDFLGKRFRVGR